LVTRKPTYEELEKRVLDKGVNFIQKPLSKQELALKVRAALDKAKT